MANLRILWNNAADRAASIAASSVAGSLAAANLQNDFKGLVCRSSGTAQVLTLTWTSAEEVGGVCLPMTNLSSSATMQVQLYSDTACTALLADSGTVSACPGATPELWNWTQPLSASSFPYGGFTKASVWFAPKISGVKGCKITLSDAGNAAGFIDLARVLVGSYWESSKNPDYGLKTSPKDTTKSERNDAGDLLSDLGVKYETMDLSLKLLSDTDRAYLTRIIRSVGTSRNILLSVFPGRGNDVLEQDHTIYGKRSDSDISADFFNQYGHTLQLQSW